MSSTINEALTIATAKIGRRDAMLLLTHATGQNSAYILLHPNENLPEYQQFFSNVERRFSGEPLQYIIGQWEFMGRVIKTDPRALIPRPETEMLVEEALKFLAPRGKGDVLDMCTGSGCIAAAVASSGPYLVTAADISADTLSLAQENGCGLNINFIQSDLFANISGQFDIIISNPPYITAQEMERLDPVVGDYEPHLALFGGTDGMDIYRQLIPESLKYLKPGGGLFLEIGPSAVTHVMEESGFTDVKLIKDYNGIDRIIYGTIT